MRTILEKQFNDLQLIKVFEIEVTDKKTNETDYVIFNVEIQDGKLIATHVALTDEEENSNKVAYKSIDLDEDYTLDQNLQELYSNCLDAVINSDYYTLVD